MSHILRRQRLRHRAVLYEASRPTQSSKLRASYICVPLLDGAQRAAHPNLSHCLDRNIQFRCPSRDCTPLKMFMQYVIEQYGVLVLITQQINHCDSLSLFEPATRKLIYQASRAEVFKFLKVYGQLTRDLYAVIQKDREGRVHHHLLLPLTSLSKAMQRNLLSATRGAGGGTLLGHLGQFHGVIVNETIDDVERLAHYLSRFPDDRLKRHILSSVRLRFLEELAERQLSQQPEGGAQARLAWKLPRRWAIVLAKDHLAEKRRQRFKARPKC